MNAEQAKLEAVKHALAGGRKFGSAEHRKAFEWLAGALADKKLEKQGFIDAAVGLANQSALQQQLAAAGIIDRADKKAVRKTMWANLKA